MIVIYHKNCADGFCAAWVFHRKYPGARFHAASYGEAPPEIEPLEEVRVVDFSYPRETLEALAAKSGGNTIVLDHHKTAEAELAGLDYAKFDMQKSGGRLAWEHCFPGEESPDLVDYTEDRDLWRWVFPQSREYNAALASLPFDFGVWDDIYQANDALGMIAEGVAILRYQQTVVDNAVKNAREVCLDGHKVLCVNATLLMSEIGEALGVGRPFGMTWFQRKDGMYQYSLRSGKDGVDVSEVAKFFGGGGHKRAAGFESFSLLV
jgi:oligoribonuclease NrnB/cAMP/cGMP phosphodiesterase (DHH superfamily)